LKFNGRGSAAAKTQAAKLNTVSPYQTSLPTKVRKNNPHFTPDKIKKKNTKTHNSKKKYTYNIKIQKQCI
jgi:hypothetical protein